MTRGSFPAPDFHYDPAYFATAFRCIVDLFRAAGVDHIVLAEARRGHKPVLLAETTPVRFNIGQNTY